jgi:hypothetical protein
VHVQEYEAKLVQAASQSGNAIPSVTLLEHAAQTERYGVSSRENRIFGLFALTCVG